MFVWYTYNYTSYPRTSVLERGDVAMAPGWTARDNAQTRNCRPLLTTAGPNGKTQHIVLKSFGS
jgi:hypothetical protein